MPTSGLITLKEISEMLDACAPGARIEPRKHRFWVYYNGLIFRNLPLGPHGNRRNPEIEVGWVKRMARHLGILECAKGFFNF